MAAPTPCPNFFRSTGTFSVSPVDVKLEELAFDRFGSHVLERSMMDARFANDRTRYDLYKRGR